MKQIAKILVVLMIAAFTAAPTLLILLIRMLLFFGEMSSDFSASIMGHILEKIQGLFDKKENQ